MAYQTDYILRIIEQISSLIRASIERLGVVPEGDADVAGQAIGVVLDMDPKVAGGLSPATLRTMLELSAVDARILQVLAEAIETEAGALRGRGRESEAMARLEQAHAVRSLL